jgi:hypothetical protein
MRITHIAPLSVGKIAFVLYGFLGLVAALLFIPMMMFGVMAQGTAEHGLPMGGAFAVGLVVVLPIIEAILGSFVAMAATVIYNVVAGMVGGVELTIEPAPMVR